MTGFETFNLFDMFGMEDPNAKKEETKEETLKLEPVVSDTEVEDEDDDMSATDDSEETSNVVSLETKKPAATTKKTKSKVIKGSDKVSLPLTVYSRNFSLNVTSLDNTTYDGLLSYLYDNNYLEVGLDIDLVLVRDGVVLLVLPRNAASDDTMVCFPENGEVTVVDGLLQASFSKEDFKDKSADEISVETVFERFLEINPQYEGWGCSYSPKTGILTPVAKEVKERITLPCSVNICGIRHQLTQDEFPASNEISAKDILDVFCPNLADKNVEASLSALSDEEGSYTITFKRGKASMVSSLKKDVFEKIKDAKVTKVEERYALPLLLVATASDQRVNITSDMFKGKERVTQVEVLELLSKNNTQYDESLIGFKLYASQDKQFNFVYGSANGSRKLVVSATSGKKG